MLTSLQSAGVAPEVNLRIIQARKHAKSGATKKNMDLTDFVLTVMNIDSTDFVLILIPENEMVMNMTSKHSRLVALSPVTRTDQGHCVDMTQVQILLLRNTIQHLWQTVLKLKVWRVSTGSESTVEEILVVETLQQVKLFLMFRFNQSLQLILLPLFVNSTTTQLCYYTFHNVNLIRHKLHRTYSPRNLSIHH